MIHVELRKLSPEDCVKLAKITKYARQGTPVDSDKTIEEISKNIEDLSISDGYRIFIALDDVENIVGWIYYYVGFPLMSFIGGFLPLVDETRESEEIAISLIEASKKDIVENERSRLEIELVLPTHEHRSYSKRFVEWYRKCGFKLAAEEIHMKTDLSGMELPDLNLPKGYTLKKFSEVPYEKLKDSGFRTLKESKEGLFLSMNHAEQEVTLEYFFDRSKPYIEDASLILEKDGEIIGFVITRMNDDDEPEIGPVGIVPEARGEGLATYLLVRVLKNLKDSGATNACLDTTVTNFPAQGLYRRYSFKEVYFKQFYYWSP
ncbi:MAG: GNAT family N-acetyltransferase [Candidatus Thorarchaeota archaeon]